MLTWTAEVLSLELAACDVGSFMDWEFERVTKEKLHLYFYTTSGIKRDGAIPTPLGEIVPVITQAGM